ncbi:MAG: MBG domain-containing protein [Clostridia bacterium]|nr:MBG domain-containing protein [Clostridia bacterium]
MALPEISGNVLTYNGAAQSATVTGYDSAVMNVTGDCTEYGNSIVITGTAAGDYSVTVALSDTNNYEWATTGSTTYTLTINALEVTITVTANDSVYGSVELPEVTTSSTLADSNITVLYTGTVNDGSAYESATAPTEAGEYSITLTLTDLDNLTLSVDSILEASYTIARKVVTLSGEDVTAVYDGTAHLLEISGFDTAAMGYAYSGSVSISGDVITVSETHAGEYAITFSLKDTDNYVWADNAEDPVFSLTIAKATANGIEWSGDILLVYGTSYDAETATATYGNIVYAYYVQGETTALGSAPSDVGVYTVTATVAETDDYVGATASITITINKAEILIEIPEITGNVLTYTGEAQSATITGYDSKLLGATGEGVDFYVAYNNSIIITETDAGSYTVTVYIIDTLNYMWSDGTTGAKTYTLTINRMAIDTPVTADGNITYDAASHTFTVTGYDAELMSYAYDGDVTANGSELTISATNAGTYTITFGFNTTNYCWSGTGSDEYTISWTIDKLVLTVPTSTSTSFISGNESTYIPEGFDETWMDIEGNTASEAGDYTATITLKDTENCVWANGTTDSISISWSISHRFTAGHIIMGVIIAILVALLVTLIVRAVIIKKKHSKNEGEENK